MDSSLGSRAVAEYLSRREHAERASTFPRDRSAVDYAGLYSWWADDDGLAVLGRALGADLPSLIYAGQAGATTAKAGIERVATLRSRICGNHLRGNAGSSTFRKTLTALLREPLDLNLVGKDRLDQVSNEAVSKWMARHLSVATVAVRDRHLLSRLEEEVLTILDPPLNLMGMRPNPLRLRIKDLRRGISTQPATAAKS